MLARVIYVKGNKPSESCMKDCVASLEKYEWNYEVVGGVTRDTLDLDEFPFPLLEGGRLEGFSTHANDKERRKYETKRSCLYNNLRLAKDVIKKNESMIFLEHDVLATAPMPSDKGVRDYCFLNMDGAFKPPSCLNKQPMTGWYKRHGHKLGVQTFPESYPLKYYKKSRYLGYNLTPGTSAYILTVSGANKLLTAAAEFGLEQSDFLINHGVLELEYMNPSPVKFQKTNPNLSHKL